MLPSPTAEVPRVREARRAAAVRVAEHLRGLGVADAAADAAAERLVGDAGAIDGAALAAAAIERLDAWVDAVAETWAGPGAIRGLAAVHLRDALSRDAGLLLADPSRVAGALGPCALPSRVLPPDAPLPIRRASFDVRPEVFAVDWASAWRDGARAVREAFRRSLPRR